MCNIQSSRVVSKAVVFCDLCFCTQTLPIRRWCSVSLPSSSLWCSSWPSRDTSYLLDWLKSNLISVNTSKTKPACFRNSLSFFPPFSHPLYIHTSEFSPCDCSHAKYTDQVKYFGIQFDNGLSSSSHLSYLCKRLRSVSPFLDSYFNKKVDSPSTSKTF